MSRDSEINELKEEINKIKAEYPIRLSRFQLKSLLFLIISYVGYTFATGITSLNIFSSGQIISSQNINDNFNYLETKINNNGELAAIFKVNTAISMSVSGALTDAAVEPFDDVSLIDPSITISGITINFSQAGIYRLVSISKWNSSDVDLLLFNQTQSTSAAYLPSNINDLYFVVEAGDQLKWQTYNMYTTGSFDHLPGSFLYLYKVSL
jgi:hypothetical protein